MMFVGVSKKFSLKNEDQYNTIGDFWDEMSLIYGLENLQGLGYKWEDGFIYYVIGLKNGEIKSGNLRIELPDEGWTVVEADTVKLKDIYNEIYKYGSLKYEIETFTEEGRCCIKYLR